MCVHASRIISLGMAKGVVMDLEGGGTKMMEEPKFEVVVVQALCLSKLHSIWSFLNSWCWKLKNKRANKSKQEKTLESQT
jgi:hypothetical protein